LCCQTCEQSQEKCKSLGKCAQTMKTETSFVECKFDPEERILKEVEKVRGEKIKKNKVYQHTYNPGVMPESKIKMYNNLIEEQKGIKKSTDRRKIMIDRYMDIRF